MATSLAPRDLIAAVILSAVAGWVDAVAFLFSGGYFVSFMSGNSTVGAVDLPSGGMWWFAASLILAFATGVILGVVGGRLWPRWHRFAAFAFVATTLAVAAVIAGLAPALLTATVLAVGMGAVNTIFLRDGKVAFGVTYMTGALVTAAQGIAGKFFGDPGWGWTRPLALWGSITLGAIGGAAAHLALGLNALWIPAAVMVALAVMAGVGAGRARAST